MEPFDLDLLQEGGWSDVLWSLKHYAPDGYKFAVKRTPHEIESDVLNSRRVQHAIQKVIMISVLISRHKKPCRFCDTGNEEVYITQLFYLGKARKLIIFLYT